MVKKSLVLALLAGLSGPAFGLSNTFTYQGSLQDGGTPASGTYDLQFTLQTQAGVPVGTALLRDDVAVAGGVFTVELDFGAAITSGDFQLQIGVRPGASTGSFTALNPATKIAPTPQAQVAGLASEAVTVSPNSIGSASVIDGSLAAVDVDSTQIQRRISSSCPADQAVRVINADGTVSCVVGPVGPQGATGPAGAVGPTGPIGPAGPQGTPGSADAWSRIGNAGTASFNFIGTTDAQPLVLRSNNVTGFRLLTPVSNVVSVVGGSATNSVGPTVVGGFIGGGGGVIPGENPNRVFGNFSVIAGGLGNTVGIEGASSSTNRFATVGGGANNQARGPRSVVGGGEGNIASSQSSTIAGGESNTAGAGNSAVGGGINNQATNANSTVVGGHSNTASGHTGTVGGGIWNCAGGYRSWAAGTRAKVRPSEAGATGSCAGVPVGGLFGDSGSYVWADNQEVDFTTTGPNQFLARADGGVGVNTALIPAHATMVLANRSSAANTDLLLRGNGFTNGINISAVSANSTTAASLFIASYNGTGFTDRLIIRPDGNFEVSAAAFKPGGGSWSVTSDKRLKSDIVPLEGALDRLLKLSGVTFRYTDPSPMRPAGTHTGFVAQEVQKVFPQWVNTDKDGYLSVGPQGFEAMTVEALRELRVEKDVEIAALKSQNDELQARLDALEATVSRLANQAER